VVEEFCWERASANACGVSLHNTDGASEAGWTNTGSDRCTASGGVGRRDERVGSVVYVEEGGLAAFHEHNFFFVERFVKDPNRVDNHWAEAFSVAHEVFDDLINGKCPAVVELHE